MFKSTPENKKRKHSEHFLHHQEPLGSQRADRTYCTCSSAIAAEQWSSNLRVTKHLEATLEMPSWVLDNGYESNHDDEENYRCNI